ncbi:metallophosphoesterase [Hugenholtzia roseola]|uniref:metallophosphoesterase n=1 Tax=Hugenholtzia roseola TaxID=1002 RepID=UPI0004166EAA|nr:metallophosphoesterase [Hugenholtzia roseola]
MADIRYICVSDLHFGASSSLLTQVNPFSRQIDPLKPSPALVYWVKALKEVVQKNNQKNGNKGIKPTLILNGDILELALCNTNEAAMCFERFIELLFPAEENPQEWLFDTQMYYLPGNHDHHLWESARETQYVNYIQSEKLKNEPYLPIPWHTTTMFDNSEGVPVFFLNKLLQRREAYKSLKVSALYPNMGIKTANGQKAIIFSHGHYIESIYMLMTELKTMIFPDRRKPEQIWDIEAENFAWISFFWSTMGRSGEVGKDIELIYNKMQDPIALRKLTDNLAQSLADRLTDTMVTEFAASKILGTAFGYLFGKAASSERGFSDQILDEKTQKGLKDFIEIPLNLQIRGELSGQIPTDLTFIFGHTHKPFEQMITYGGYPQGIKVYNDGGWVVDTVKTQPLHGGAMLFIDENLDTVSLRIYNENNYEVHLAEAKYPNQPVSPLYEALQNVVNPQDDLWRGFGETLAQEIKVRQDLLEYEIKMRSAE